MDSTQLLAQLNVRLGDSDNFTFTPEEKQDALYEAFDDDYAVKPIWNDSLTFTTGTFQYAKPTGVDVIQDIYIKGDNNVDEPQKIDSTLWEVVDTNIHFKMGANLAIPTGWTLYVKGKTKYDSDDTVTEKSIQQYILNLAQLKLLRMLGVKKALRFLKNDTSVAEIVAIKNELEREVAQYRRRLPTAWENS